MTDLASLGLRIESQQADKASAAMDKMAASADRAERSADKLGAGSTKADGAIAGLLASIDRTTKEMLELSRLHQQAGGAALVHAGATEKLATEMRQASTAGMYFAASFKAAQTDMGGANSAVRDYATAVRTVTREIGQADSHMALYRANIGKVGAGLKLTAQDSLNFTRQMADVGVTAAMGMNPFMIALQQGPQLFEILQVTAIRSQMTIRQTMMATGAVIWTALAPILPLIAAVAVGAGALAAGWGLATRSISKGIGDVTDGMGLNEKQLKKLKDENVTTTATAGDAWRGLGTTIKEMFASVFGDQLSWISKQWNALLNDLTKNTGTEVGNIIGFFEGAYEGVVAVWQNFPAVFGDIIAMAANGASSILNDLVKNSVGELNFIIRQLNTVHKLTGGVGVVANEIAAPDNMFRTDRATTGAAGDVGAAISRGFARGQARPGQFMDAWRGNTEDSAEARLRKEAGEAGKGAKAGKTDAEREYEALIKAGKAYRDGIIEERAVLGMTALERKAYEAQAQADLLIKKGQTAEARALAAEILKEAAALREATIANEVRQSQKKAGEQLEVLRLERDLIGANNVVRARQIAMLEEEIRLRNLYGQAFINTPQAQTIIGGAGDVAAQQEGNRQAVERYNSSMELALDLARQIDDQMRSMGQGLADSFGRAGEAVGNAASALSGYRVQLAEINERERKYRETLGEGEELNARIAMLAKDRGQAEMDAYGSALSAAKGFFAEGSDGYRALQAAEAAWRVFSFAMSVQAMAQQAAETSASVAGSAAKGTASAAAGAAKMFEALGPFGFPVVAAMIALLASLGLKGKGGGGGGSAPSVDGSVAKSQGYAQQADATQSSFAASVAQKVDVRVSADRDGIKAYIEGTAAEVAAPMVAQGMAAAAGATRAQVMSDLDKGRTYSRGG